MDLESFGVFSIFYSWMMLDVWSSGHSTQLWKMAQKNTLCFQMFSHFYIGLLMLSRSQRDPEGIWVMVDDGASKILLDFETPQQL
jgi:predicted ribosome-associated RNA-binding protein Tma20